jgi:UDP-N-acetylglucosamine 2-epimerase (non-hydrolysing)
MTSEHRPRAILCVVGARPNFMKIAPVLRAFGEATPAIPALLLHTGQHYDQAMQRQFFEDLGIRAPEFDLGVGSASHAVQTAEIMVRFEPVLERVAPAAVLVVGDVNSTLACALVAAKRGVPVFHVEAGLRSDDRAMPEEINRVLTDQLSELLFTTEASARERLLREGVSGDRVVFAGNVMIDTLLSQLERAVPAAETLDRYAAAQGGARLADRGYGVVTLHRPTNVDDRDTLVRLLACLSELSTELPLVFPVHPRAQARIEAAGLQDRLAASALALTPPLGYLQMLGLVRAARLVLTDSGGLQEETTALGVPCLTLRHNTERPITVELGTNRVVGTSPERILGAAREALRAPLPQRPVVPGWDGRAAARIAEAINRWLDARPGS